MYLCIVIDASIEELQINIGCLWIFMFYGNIHILTSRQAHETDVWRDNLKLSQ